MVAWVGVALVERVADVALVGVAGVTLEERVVEGVRAGVAGVTLEERVVLVVLVGEAGMALVEREMEGVVEGVTLVERVVDVALVGVVEVALVERDELLALVEREVPVARPVEGALPPPETVLALRVVWVALWPVAGLVSRVRSAIVTFGRSTPGVHLFSGMGGVVRGSRI